jgi:hypothetical protein
MLWALVLQQMSVIICGLLFDIWIYSIHCCYGYFLNDSFVSLWITFLIMDGRDPAHCKVLGITGPDDDDNKLDGLETRGCSISVEFEK